MIFIVISVDVRADNREEFLDGITRYSGQVRDEPGSRHFTCYESVEDSGECVIVANYVDDTAGQAHVASQHARWFFG